MPLHVAGEQIFLPERETLGVISAVEGAGKRRTRRQTLAFLRPVQNGTVIADRRRDVLLPPHPTLDLQRGDARLKQLFDALADAEIGQRERIGALLKAFAVDGVQLAAGLFASAAVAAVVAREGGKIALPRKAGAQRPLHEHLRLNDFGDGGNIADRRLPREHDARKAVLFGKLRPVHVAAARLRRKMQNDGRIPPFELLPQENILDEEGIRPCIPGRKRAFKKGVCFAVFDKRVQTDVHLRPEKMGKAHRF